MLGFNYTFEPKILKFRKEIDIKQDIEKILNWLFNLTGMQLKNLKIIPKQILLNTGLITIYEVKYKFINPYNNNQEHNYSCIIPMFINDYYIFINGMRYAFIYSFVDKALTRFGSQSTNAKLSNLYIKVELKNVLTDKPLIISIKKYNDKLFNFLLAYYYITKELEDWDELIKYTLSKFKGINIIEKELDEKIRPKNKKNLIECNRIDDTTFVIYNYMSKKEYLIENVIHTWHQRIFNDIRAIRSNVISNALLGKKTSKQGSKIIVTFLTAFDLFTLEMLNVKDADEFVQKYLIDGYTYDAIKDMKMHTNVNTKRVMIKLFLLHPLIRQVMRIYYDFWYDKGKNLPKKHSITLSILHKILQLELAEGKINNPISEIALNTKISYMNKFALKRNSQKVRFISNPLKVLDLAATPETKKVGSVNWLVLGYDGAIE